MIVPYEHAAALEELADETLVELIRLARDCVQHVRAVYRPEGLNLGMNLGRSAGAGIAEHVHLHVLPRWTGDTSFITTVGETRVVPEDLEVTWEKLRRAFREEPV
jgi:ATP adenylyltransferase